jgi:Flp pilus assembly protein TadG
MKKGRGKIYFFNRTEGSVLVMVSLMLAAFIALAALAIDLGHLYVVRTELKTAANAAALEAAANFLNGDGTINGLTYELAADQAARNQSDKIPVSLATGDVQLGHWCAGCNGGKGLFTPNTSSTEEPMAAIMGQTAGGLDADTEFINAVRVTATQTKVQVFFAGIFGTGSPSASAEAIAYVGFADSLFPTVPLAICKQNLSCSGGGSDRGNDEDDDGGTGGSTISSFWSWTNYTSGSCSSSDIDADDICTSKAPRVNVGDSIWVTNNNGNSENSYDGNANGELVEALVQNCLTNQNGDNDHDWWNDGDGEGSWSVTLPVIDCPSQSGNNEQHEDNDGGSSGCVKVVGSVAGQLSIQDENKIYFNPNCTFRETRSRPGGANYGDLSKPVLVK